MPRDAIPLFRPWSEQRVRRAAKTHSEDDENFCDGSTTKTLSGHRSGPPPGAEFERYELLHRYLDGLHRAVSGAGHDGDFAEERRRALDDRPGTYPGQQSSVTEGATGWFSDTNGLRALRQAVLWASKSNSALTLAFVDLGGTVLRGRSGNSAHEEGLERSVAVIREHIRSRDLIVRYGSSLFLCGLPGMNLPEAHRRFDQISTQTSEAGYPRLVVGLAQLRAAEGLGALIRRADDNLFIRRRQIRRWESNAIVPEETSTPAA